MVVEVGARYLTVSGLPVQVAEIAAGHLVLQSLVSDNRISVPASYPLCPMGRREPVFKPRASPYSRRPERAAIGTGYRPLKPLAPIIDAMLLAGGKTMRGIVREIRRKASRACRGRDLEANVRARLYWLRKRGYRIERAEGRVRAVLPLISRLVRRRSDVHSVVPPPNLPEEGPSIRAHR